MKFKIFALATIFLILGCAYATGEVADQPLSIKEDGGKLYVGYNKGNIRIFDALTLEVLKTIPAERRFVFSIETDSRNIYYGTDATDIPGRFTNISKTVAVTKDGSPVSSQNGTAFVLAMFIDGGKLYTCEKGSGIKIYSLPNLKLADSIENKGYCRTVRVDDRHIYSTSTGNIIVWDKTNLKEIKKIADAHTMVIKVLWDDEDNIYSVADDGKLKIWNKADFSLKKEIMLAAPWDLTGDNNFLYATSREKILVLDKNGSIVETLNSGGISIFDLYSSKDYLYSAHDDGTIKIWDKKTFKNMATSDIFQFKSRKWQSIDAMKNIFYILLAIGIIGFVAATIIERRKKKFQPIPNAQQSAPITEAHKSKDEVKKEAGKEAEHKPADEAKDDTLHVDK